MSLPKLPFSFQQMSVRADLTLGNGHVYLLDADGRKIASLWGKPREKLALASFICDTSDMAALVRRAARIMAVTVEQVENPANGAHSLSAFAHGARIAEMKQFIADLSALPGGAEGGQ